MRWIALAAALALAVTAGAETALTGRCAVSCAAVGKGREILQRRDDFVARMSPFDRAARMRTDRDVSEAEFLAFVGRNVLPWSRGEEEKVSAAVRALRPRLAAFRLDFPPRLFTVKTTGREEGGAAYTRGEAIVLPSARLSACGEELRDLICHELFHVLSRFNPALREECYGIIGFRKCGEIELPDALKPRAITNPDAPRNDHWIGVRAHGRPVCAVPVLYSDAARYDPRRGGDFFDYLVFRMLAFEPGRNGAPAPTRKEAAPALHAVGELTGFFEQVGRNSDYVIHPDEILAENFVLLVNGAADVPSPELLDKMRTVLSGAQPVFHPGRPRDPL